MFDPMMDLWPMIEMAAKFLFASGMGGAMYVVVGLMLAVAIARRVLSERFPVLKSDLGAALFTVVLGVLCGVANAVLAGTAASWGVVLAAFGVAVQAAGGYSLLKKLVLPLLDRLEPNMPASLRWIVPVLRLVISAFGAKAPTPEQVKADAEAAGNAAVEAKPAKGAAGVVGEPEDVA